MKREKNPVPSGSASSTSTAKKQLQLPCTSVSAKTAKSQSSSSQQQNQIIINTSGSSPIISGNSGNADSNLNLNLLVDNDASNVKDSLPISNSSSVVGCSSGSSKEPVDILEILEEKVSGYNSGDEYLGQKETLISNEEWKRVS